MSILNISNIILIALIKIFACVLYYFSNLKVKKNVNLKNIFAKKFLIEYNKYEKYNL